jgi:hypothetical protein
MIPENPGRGSVIPETGTQAQFSAAQCNANGRRITKLFLQCGTGAKKQIIMVLELMHLDVLNDAMVDHCRVFLLKL